MRPQQRGGRVIAICGLLLLLISGVAAAQATVTDSPIVFPNVAADGDGIAQLADPAHAWVAGDLFSLHGVDRYRYIVVYTRDTADGQVHGCYEVDQEASGRCVVSQYVHGQEVFDDAFLAEQGAKFLATIPLDEVVITDDTPVDGGKTYFGRTLGSIYGVKGTPSPTATPEPIPTAPSWPVLQPTGSVQGVKATPTQTPTAAPTGVVGATLTPGPEPTVPENASPYPMPTMVPTAAGTQPVVTEPTGEPGIAPGTAPVLAPTPEPAVTPAPSRTWGRRLATWQAPSTTGRRVTAEIAPGTTVSPVERTTRTAPKAYSRVYPGWSPVGRSTA